MAHKLGMKVILDFVANHTDWDCTLVTEHPDWFHRHEDIKNWNDKKEIEEGWLTGLPDFNQENPEVFRYLVATAKYWIQETQCDGLRLDAVKHIPLRFWEKFIPAVKQAAAQEGIPDFYMFGEVLHGDPRVIATYFTAPFDGLVDFPLYYNLKDVFGAGTRNPASLSQRIRQDNLYPNDAVMMPFVDNHDVPRFLSIARNHPRERLQLALAYMFTLRGSPIIYYGTEFALSGKSEEEARQSIDWNKKPILQKYIGDIARLRTLHPSLRSSQYHSLLAESTSIAHLKSSQTEDAFCFFNLAATGQWVSIPLRNSYSLQPQSTRTGALSGIPIFITPKWVSVYLPPFSAEILFVEKNL